MADPFQTLGLSPGFDLSTRQVEAAYLKRIASAHPDAVGPDHSDASTESLNSARALLLNPEERANSLLEILGGPGKSQVRELPEGFLALMMERRQEIEASLATGDPDATPRWNAWALAQREEYEGVVSQLFQSFDESGDVGTLRDIRVQLNAWRYIERLIEQLTGGGPKL